LYYKIVRGQVQLFLRKCIIPVRSSQLDSVC